MVLVTSLVLALTLAFVPAGIVASHGPGAFAATPVADAASAHVHTWEEADAAQHDATDHEHQTAAILVGAGCTRIEKCDGIPNGNARIAVGYSRDGPRKPPRRA
jgi:hypothetical protein